MSLRAKDSDAFVSQYIYREPSKATEINLKKMLIRFDSCLTSDDI